MPKRRMAEWVVVGVLSCLLLFGGFLVAVFHASLLTAAGLTREGAPDTVDVAIFEAPEAEESEAPATAGTGLAQAAGIPTDGKVPDSDTLTAQLKALDRSNLKAADGSKVTVAWEVVDVETGDVISSSKAKTALIPASNTKLMTSLAVMNAFDGSETFATRVLQPADGEIVLVGGGDPMLLSTPADEGTYPQPASTQELAAATAEALKADGQSSVTLGYDDSYFDEEGWNDTWPSNYRDQVTQLSSLWVDEGRTSGARTRTPAADAAKIFATQLEKAGITVTGSVKERSGTGDELARVESLPLHVLVETAMNRSNNSFTEILGLQLAKQTGRDSTFKGAVAAIKSELSDLGVWDEGTVLRDSSGLSRSNRITANMLARAVQLLDTDEHLSVILDGLPTAGVTGTLATRFTDAVARPARGVASAKTGTLSLVSTLAGTTLTADDRQVSFAFMINGTDAGWWAKLWADQATGVVASCGC